MDEQAREKRRMSEEPLPDEKKKPVATENQRQLSSADPDTQQEGNMMTPASNATLQPRNVFATQHRSRRQTSRSNLPTTAQRQPQGNPQRTKQVLKNRRIICHKIHGFLIGVLGMEPIKAIRNRVVIGTTCSGYNLKLKILHNTTH